MKPLLGHLKALGPEDRPAAPAQRPHAELVLVGVLGVRRARDHVLGLQLPLLASRALL